MGYSAKGSSRGSVNIMNIALREAKEKNQKWHWVNIDCPEGVNISAVVRAIVEMLARERWGVSD